MGNIKRYGYKPKKYGLSDQNEPPLDRLLTVNIRNYPDMAMVYEKFSKAIEKPLNRFILGNGAENVIKNVLLAVKPKNLCWHEPTWNMLEVYCEALGIEPIRKQFHVDTFGNIQNDDVQRIKGVDVYYCNCGTTSLFQYQNCGYPECRYIIYDVTYLCLEEMKVWLKVLSKDKNAIIVGSLGKIYGCGIRLGFAVFPEELNDAMQLQREQYLNSVAADFILNENLNEVPASEFKNKLWDIKPQGSSLTYNYFTVPGKYKAEFPHKHFQIENHWYTKFGMPINYTEFEALRNVLNNGKEEDGDNNR